MNGNGCRLDQLLGFLQTQTGNNRTGLLDDLDLGLGIKADQFDVKGRLRLGRSTATTHLVVVLVSVRTTGTRHSRRQHALVKAVVFGNFVDELAHFQHGQIDHFVRQVVNVLGRHLPTGTVVDRRQGHHRGLEFFRRVKVFGVAFGAVVVGIVVVQRVLPFGAGGIAQALLVLLGVLGEFRVRVLSDAVGVVGRRIVGSEAGAGSAEEDPTSGAADGVAVDGAVAVLQVSRLLSLFLEEEERLLLAFPPLPPQLQVVVLDLWFLAFLPLPPQLQLQVVELDLLLLSFPLSQQQPVAVTQTPLSPPLPLFPFLVPPWRLSPWL